MGRRPKTCVRIALATDSPTEQGRFSLLFTRWVDDGDDRGLETEDDLLIVTSCAPLIP